MASDDTQDVAPLAHKTGSDSKPLSLYRTLRIDMSVLTVQGQGPLSMLGCLMRRSGFLAVFFHRLAAASVTKGLLGRVGASILMRLNIFFNGCDISPRAVIGPGFKLSHPVGVVIGPAVVGSNVMMMQGVTLGMRHFTDAEDDPANYPVIGDNVIISTGAKIIGGIKIGDHALIGANAVVLKDVPPYSTAVGIPARLVNVKSRPQDA